ncbi:hypothetical protein [Pseudomonas brassicacearum]|uniref:hypothetical protein n=1 Tax=Pseudomonas brassicacearum TaxID=930166 RepID=UPI0011CD95D7|nr:hypothetical protein [Pseudomonas brassicacearum]
MEYKKAEIVVRKETGQPKTLPEVAFTFNQNRPSLSQNIAAYKPGTDGHCWLGIKTEPFEDWAQQPSLIFHTQTTVMACSPWPASPLRKEGGFGSQCSGLDQSRLIRTTPNNQPSS